MSGVVQKGIL